MDCTPKILSIIPRPSCPLDLLHLCRSGNGVLNRFAPELDRLDLIKAQLESLALDCSVRVSHETRGWPPKTLLLCVGRYIVLFVFCQPSIMHCSPFCSPPSRCILHPVLFQLRSLARSVVHVAIFPSLSSRSVRGRFCYILGAARLGSVLHRFGPLAFRAYFSSSEARYVIPLVSDHVRLVHCFVQELLYRWPEHRFP